MKLDFSNYHLDVNEGVDSMLRQEWAALSSDALFEVIGLKHHSKLVSFILECQTYPTPQSMILALTIANNFNPAQQGAWPSQSTLGELLGVSRDVIRKYSADLESTGYWEIEKNPRTNFITYRLSRATMMVFGHWMAQDKLGKRGYGTGSPNIVSKANKARPNNRVTNPVVAAAKAVAEGQEAMFSDAGTTPAQIDTVRTVVNDMSVKESLNDSEKLTLTQRLVYRLASGEASSQDDLLVYSSHLMDKRRMSMAPAVPTERQPEPQPMFSSSLP